MQLKTIRKPAEKTVITQRALELTTTKILLASAVLLAGAASVGASAEVDNRRNGIEQVTVVGKQLSERTTNVGKLSAQLTEIPFSVSVITQDFFTATGVKTVQDALQYSAGVNGGPYGIDTRGDWATIRGVSPAEYKDGLKTLFGSYNNTRTDPYTLERVEILKGPASVGYGQSGTGGVINYVSKRPQAEAGGEVWAQSGTFDRQQLAVDMTGPLDTDGEWLYRVVALKREAGTQTDYVSDDSLVLAPSLSWRPSENTDITLLLNRQENSAGTSTQFLPWYGTQLANPNGEIDQSLFASEPEWDRYDSEQTAATLSFTHQLTEVLSLAGNLRHSTSEVDYRTMWPAFTAYPGSLYLRLMADGRTVMRTALASKRSADALSYDVRLNADFSTGTVEHQLVLGYDVQDVTTDNDYVYLSGGPLDLFDPEYGQSPIGDYEIEEKASTTLQQQGVYLMDQIKFDHWVISTGLRRDEVQNSVEGQSNSEDSSATTAQLGVLYAFESGVSPYVSYTESFEPVSGVNKSGERFKPTEGEQIEAGVKYQPAGSNLLFTAAIYEIEERNRLVTDPSDPTNQIQAAGAKISGVELEMQATWAQVDLIASYTKVDAKYQQLGLETTHVEAVPEELLSAWATYRFTDDLFGLRVGLGARHVGKTWNGSDNEALSTDSYTLVDGMVGYEVNDWFLSLNGRNLADKQHITSCLNRGDCFVGEARTLTADVRYSF